MLLSFGIVEKELGFSKLVVANKQTPNSNGVMMESFLTSTAL